jgi:tetratricopeptide (TPR) repeat protein
MPRTLAAAAAVWLGLAALAFGAGEAERAFEQAQRALDQGDYDAAIARLDEAIRLEPKQAKFQGLRGLAWLRKGQYAKGMADLKAAIQLTPGDAGAQYQPSSTKQLAGEALRHGQQQVAKMVGNRPAMSQFGQQSDFLRQWAARKFAGEDFGAPVDWDPAPPLHSDAEHTAPADDENAAILVEGIYTEGPRKGQPRSFEELWAGAVYELHNVVYCREYVRLNDEADQGKVSKEAFVGGILKYELRAAQQTRAFYLQVFLPWAEKTQLPTDPSLWFCDWWATPEMALKGFPDKSTYPWQPYGRAYDWATVHRHWRHGRFDGALRLLERMRDEKGYEEDRADVQYWIGRCLARLNKPAEAIAALSEAIRLDPRSAAAHQARGQIYQKLGEQAKAEADFTKAKKLEADD